MHPRSDVKNCCSSWRLASARVPIAKPLSSSPSTILLIPMRGTCVNTSTASGVPCLKAT
jgi:hypothetical protein